MSTKSTVSAPLTTTGPSLSAVWPLEETPFMRKNSRCQLRMRRTSSGDRMAATSGPTWSQTQDTASSNSKTRPGALVASRRASRPTTMAAMAKTAATASAPRKIPMAAEGSGRPQLLSQIEVAGQQLAVVAGIAEQLGRRPGPLEVQVGVVVPGEPQPPVDVEGVGGHPHEGVRAG